MTITGNQYETARGGRVDDSANHIKKLYPHGEIFPDGRNDSLRYAWYIRGPDDQFLKFEIDHGIVKGFHVYHEIP